MRILQVTDAIRQIGGTERAVGTLCNALVAQGHTVALVHSDGLATPANPDPEQLSEAVERIYLPALFPSVPSPARVRAVRSAIETIETWRPDIVHMHSMFDPLSTMLLARRHHVLRTHHTVSVICPGGQKLKYRTESVCTQPFGPLCFVSSVRDDCTRTSDGRQMRKRFIARRLAEATANRWIGAHNVTEVVGSHYMGHELVHSGYHPSNVAVIPLGIDVPLVDLSEHRRNGTAPHLLFAGRLVRQKGVHVLLDALSIVGSPFSLSIAGDGPEREALERQVRQLNLTASVSFLGWVPGDGLFERMMPDIVVIPSICPETFGLAGIEALAQGVPVVALANGAIGEWLRDGETGWLASTTGSNTDALANALRRALSTTDEERRRMGARGRKMALDNYTVGAYVRRIEELYRTHVHIGSPVR